MVVLLLGMVFTIVPDAIRLEEMGYPLSPMRVTMQTWCYFLFEGIIKVFFSWMIYAESVKYRFPLFVFLMIQILDVFDYILTYNSVWFHAGPVPVSMNTCGIVIFAMAIIRERW